MKTSIAKGPPRSRMKQAGSAALLAAMAFALPQAALAQLAAGTAITNTATVTYADAAGTGQAPESSLPVTVTVALVGAVSWDLAPAGQTVPSAGALSPDYTLTLVNGGNGSDTFTLADGTTQSVGDLGAGTFTLTGDAVNSITLHGTIASGAGVFGGVNTVIPVYNQTITDLVDNTTRVRIGGTDFTVAAGHTATSLVVVGDASAVTADGTQIGEVGSITYSGNVGTLSAPSTTATHDHDITATGTSEGGNAAASSGSLTWSTTVTRVALTVTKYVRNATDNNDNATGVGPQLINGQTYYTSGVTGNADSGGGGDVLEYVVVIENTGGGDATDVQFTDTLSSYTTYVPGSTKLDTNGDGTYDVAVGVGGETDGTDIGGFAITVNAGTGAITVMAGTGGDEGTAIPGGTVTPGSTTVILYQATIN